MENLEKLAENYINEGYSIINAQARVCQDIVLNAISKSNFDRNITVKGGVVMRSITSDIRRATVDMNLDFIRYSLNEPSIRRFVGALNCIEGIGIEIIGEIEELSQQEYRGKRVNVEIKDETGHSFVSKIDFGVHKNVQIEQEEYCFDICSDDKGVCLLINSKEQIFAEKLRSLLKFGPLSTRYKDIYDLCYLTNCVDRNLLLKCMEVYIFEDVGMREKNINDVRKRVEKTFNNRIYRANIERSKKSNWMEIETSIALDKIVLFLKNIC